MIGFDRWGPNDEYPDDPDYECKDCGHPFNKPMRPEWDGRCPECDSDNIGGGGIYG